MSIPTEQIISEGSGSKTENDQDHPTLPKKGGGHRGDLLLLGDARDRVG